MKKCLIISQIFAVVIFFLISCGGSPKDEQFRPPEGSIFIPEGGWELSFPEDAVATTDSTSTIARCTGPRPQQQGCSQICKPCFFFVCKNGEWTRTAVRWPEGLCNRRPAGGSLTNVCVKPPSENCPAECHVCVFNTKLICT